VEALPKVPGRYAQGTGDLEHAIAACE
jgi:hypothetical protein